jgi:hypothetical protein
MPEPHRLGVDVHDHVPVVFIDIHEEPGLVQAGIEETDIDRAEGVDRRGDGGRVVLALVTSIFTAIALPLPAALMRSATF